MKTENLVWYPVERDEIPAIAFGMDKLLGKASHFGAMPLTSSAPASVAFARDSTFGPNYHPPALIMLRKQAAAETISWLRTFARDAFPLSQFARVVSDSDWELLDSARSEGRESRTDRWASIVLGEMLAQGEPDAEIDSIPLSRAAACFTASIARAEFIHDSFDVTRLCTERLRAISDDGRFVKRVIPIDSLVPVWAAGSARMDDSSSLLDIVELALHAAEASERSSITMSEPQATLKNYPNLFSDSVEDRVVAFQRLAGDIIGSGIKERRHTSVNSAMLAAGAFLVGRGTSHSFLLRKHPALAPMAFVWFGLMAAFRGARGWDPVWLRAAKGVERQLRSTFSWQDPPAADICWTEFEWLSTTINGAPAFNDLGRQFFKTLSVEVVPGSVCQFRMASDAKVDDVRRPDVGIRDSEVKATLEMLVNLSNKARHLLVALGNDTPVRQTDLGFSKPVTPPPSKAKPKRNYKRTEK